MYAHLFRIDSKSAQLTKERYLAAVKAERLLNSMLQISLAHNWLDVTDTIITAIQCFVQAVPLGVDAPVAELLQIGGIQLSTARHIFSKAGPVDGQGIQGFYQMADSKRRDLVAAEEIGDKQYYHMVKVAAEWPRLELVDAFFKVSGERLVTTGAIVQFVVKVRTLPPKKDSSLLIHGVKPDQGSGSVINVVRSGENDDNEGDANGKASDGQGGHTGRDAGKQSVGVARAPHFVEERKPHWWVYIGDRKQNRVIVQPTKFTDVGPNKIRTFTVQFQAPPSAGTYTFEAQVRSDSYLGADASKFIALQVEDPSVLEDGDVEDDISEPDEDSLAGQMAMMRGQSVKASAVHSKRGNRDDDESGTDADSDDDNPSDSDTDAE